MKQPHIKTPYRFVAGHYNVYYNSGQTTVAAMIVSQAKVLFDLADQLDINNICLTTKVMSPMRG